MGIPRGIGLDNIPNGGEFAVFPDENVLSRKSECLRRINYLINVKI